EPLHEQARRALESIWTAIIEASGGSVELVASASQDSAVGGVTSPTIEVPSIAPPPPPTSDGTVSYELSAAVLFRPNSPDLFDPELARTELDKIASKVVADVAA